MQNERIKYLFQQHMAGRSTQQEKEELALLALRGGDLTIPQLMEKTWEEWEGTEGMEQDKANALLQSILPPKAPVAADRYIPFYTTPWLRYAAIILILAGTGTYLWLGQKQPAGSLQNTGKVGQLADAPPGGNKATLTLGDGSVIVLDSAADGQITSQGGTNILKLNAGMLSYKAGSTSIPRGQVLYNTISTPRGGQYQVVLPDGSNVWLNAASSVRFPTLFVGSERRVQVEGEAYFEVSPDSRRPFVVYSGELEIQVLGTSFNINAYTNEAFINTTLLNGSVKVVKNSASRLLQPGQQAQVAHNLQPSSREIAINPHADIEKTMAWKNGLFNFEGATLKEVMNQLERWYNIEVVYEGDVPYMRFFGKVSRNIMLSDLIKGLEDNEVKFRMGEGRRMFVSAYPARINK